MLTVSGKALGRKKPLFDEFSVSPPANLSAGQPVTLRELLGHVVRAEVAAFKQRSGGRGGVFDAPEMPRASTHVPCEASACHAFPPSNR
jgi:hypothetical protein